MFQLGVLLYLVAVLINLMSYRPIRCGAINAVPYEA